MKRILSLFLAIVVACSISGCSGSGVSSVGTPSAASATPSGSVTPTKGWSTCSPEEQDLDSAVLSLADQRIRGNYPNVFSLLVVRHGYLVYEKYYNGVESSTANPVYSVTKSVMSALTGIAVREKLIQGENQKVSDLLPEYFTQVDDTRKKDITVREVLTMTGGLEPIDNNYGSFYASGDFLAYTVKQRLTDLPGTKFDYNTGLPQFLSVAISKKSGMDTRKFAEKYLFSQIGMSPGEWDRDSKGYYCGGTGLYLTSRDMAKFGYLYLHKGQWDGRQVIPQDWVEKSTKKQVSQNAKTDYGYLFWVEPMRDPVKGVTYDAFRADGAGGQKIVIIPKLDLIAVVTADVRKSSIDGKDNQNIVSDYVLPAVK